MNNVAKAPNRSDSKKAKSKENKLPPAQDPFVCRICLCSDDSNKNPFVVPCKCAGTMGLIHIDCLREWLTNKRQRRVGDYVTTYCWKNLDCELCNAKFPNVLEVIQKAKSGLNVTKKINLIDL